MEREVRVVQAGSTRLRVGVVGAGRWGRNLVRSFSALPDAQVTAISDLARPSADVLGGAEFFPDFHGLLESPHLDAVVIATPAELHAPQAIAAIERGRHVFVEKPMALSLRDALRMRDAARDAGVVLMVGHLLRYHPAVLQLKRWLVAGHLGQVEGVLALRLGPGTPDAVNDPWWSLAPHDLSLLRYLLPDDVTEITVRRGTLEAATTVVAHAKVASATAHLVVSAAYPAKVRRLVVFGSERVARFDDGPGAPTLALHEGPLPHSGNPAIDIADLISDAGAGFGTVHFPPVEPLAAEVAHFVSAVLSGGRVATDGDEGCRVIAVLEAGALSLSQNGTWTKVASKPHGRRLWRSEPEQLR
jgi:UDP-2-acetamido-3-amino-2,3-dideoxy-glucuronate N-acetyltransferase